MGDVGLLRGLSRREIAGQLRELSGRRQRPRPLVSAVADAVLDEVSARQAHPLDPTRSPVFLDATRRRRSSRHSVNSNIIASSSFASDSKLKPRFGWQAA